MIEEVRAYIKTIAEFLIFIMVIRLIATEKSAKYVNFVSGLILLLVACTPVLNLFSSGGQSIGEALSQSLNNYSYSVQAYSAENMALKSVFKEQLLKSIQDDVSALGIESEGVSIQLADDFESTGSIEKVTVTAENEGDYSEAENFLKQKYGLEKAEIIHK